MDIEKICPACTKAFKFLNETERSLMKKKEQFHCPKCDTFLILGHSKLYTYTEYAKFKNDKNK